MKYYGIKKKCRKEEFSYVFAREYMRIQSILPSKRQEFWKRNYINFSHKGYSSRVKSNNSIPANHSFRLNSFIVSDIIRREDIYKLKKGLIKLLKKYRSGRFLDMFIGTMDEICNKIEHMDSTLSYWYPQVECGTFEFSNHRLKSSFDYFSLSIHNINSAFLSLQFEVHLSQQKEEQLDNIISMNYTDERGYAKQTLTAKKEGGAFDNYLRMHYSDEALKADKIYEFLGCLEWDFMETLSHYFPFVLHGREIMPPRIEVYYTDIDYQEHYDNFWNSIGVNAYQGQFIDERQKMFFETTLSPRYDRTDYYKRLLYIIKDDGIKPGHLESVKDQVSFHLHYYSVNYFRILFLDIISEDAGKQAVIFKQELDKIKLKQNKLSSLLKLQYNFLRVTDDYNRYVRDSNVKKTIDSLATIYESSIETINGIEYPYIISFENFCTAAERESQKVEKNIGILLADFEDKKVVLQNLSDYKNTGRSMILNFVMMIIAAVTLFFVLFPDKATETAQCLIWIKDAIIAIILWIWENIRGILIKLKIR